MHHLLHKLTSVNGLQHQRLTIKKLLKQPILKNMMPNVVLNSKQYEIAYGIVGSMKDGWQGIKGYHNTNDMRAQNVLTTMVVLDFIQSLSAMG